MKQLTLKKVTHVSFKEVQPQYNKVCANNHYLITLIHNEKFAVFYGQTLLGVIGMEQSNFSACYFSLSKIECIRFAK